MFKYLLAAALLITPATAASQDMDSGWTQVPTDGHPNIYLRDQDWLKGRSHHTAINVWVRMVAGPREREVESFMTYYQFNCVQSTYRILSSTAYLRDGSNTTLPARPDIQHIVPETNMAVIADYVCTDPQVNWNS